MTSPHAPRGSALAALFASLASLGVEYAGAISGGTGGKFACPNPDHQDDHPSFDVHIGRSGKPLFTCTPCREAMGQDDFVAVLRSHGVKWGGAPITDPDSVDWGPAAVVVSPTSKKGTKGSVVLTAVYTYCHEDGTPNFRVKRYDPDEGSEARKHFRPEAYVAGVGFKGGRGALDGAERTPLYLERFEEWAGGVLYLVEGEKAAEALVSVGKAVTTFHGGTAGKLEPGWAKRYGFDRFAQVRVWPDADEAGVERARALLKDLHEAGVRAVPWGIPAEHMQPKDDAYDALERGVVGRGRTLSREDATRLSALSPKPGFKRGPESPSKRLEVAGKGIVSAEPYSGGSGDVADEDERPYATSISQETYQFTEEFLDREFRAGSGALTLRFRHDDRTFWLWSETEARYTHLTEDEVRAVVAKRLVGATETFMSAEGPEARPVKVTPKAWVAVVECLRLLTLTSDHGAGALLPSVGGVPFRNGWLDVETGELVPIGPERDVRWNVPADYDTEARCPGWFEFLDSLGWVKGSGERRLLRQWLGYLLSGSTAQQKAMLLLGPKRAGKGTILSVAEGLLGAGAVGTQLDAFASNFGMQNLIGKGLATIGDARFSLKTDKKVVERILSMTSGDTMTIDVKHKDPLSVRLGARLMIATNESPKFIEASDALATRFLVLQFTKTFYGHEDLGLRRRVLSELPGIARWALGGYRELVGLGSFTETDAGLGLQDQMIRDSAPVRVFVEEECERGTEFWVESQSLFDEYLLWAERNNMFKMDRQSFFRDLNTAYPGEVVDYYRRIGQKQKRCKKGLRLR